MLQDNCDRLMNGSRRGAIALAVVVGVFQLGRSRSASHQPHRKPHRLFAGDGQCGDETGQQHLISHC
ncbi:MAG: hypothetical protein F6K45_14410 [Kamptonema sp. SIO1D9]|nr:hypothetical protein [Kamptonema sp. SIO1D9]